MAEELAVEVRQTRGKRNSRRLRKAGSIPAVLYGHGKENVCLSVPGNKLDALVQHGGRLVTLTFPSEGDDSHAAANGQVGESAFIRQLQWDTWGTHVLHVDFTRISAHEKVEVRIAIELRGEAPGVKEGGVVEQLIHDVQLNCPAVSVPEKLSLSINGLKLHDSITLADLELPKGATVQGDAGTVVVHCIEPVQMAEEEVAEAAPGEPEVIGAKEDEKEKREES